MIVNVSGAAAALFALIIIILLIVLLRRKRPKTAPGPGASRSNSNTPLYVENKRIRLPDDEGEIDNRLDRPLPAGEDEDRTVDSRYTVLQVFKY